jgi:hypothetical protein
VSMQNAPTRGKRRRNVSGDEESGRVECGSGGRGSH